MATGQPLPGPRPDASLLGRATDIRTVADAVARGRSAAAVLLVHGEAGVGKSSLLDTARDTADVGPGRLLAATGIQAEAHLPFAGLHQLLRPVLDRAPELPPGQCRALLAAFGMSEALAPELFLVGLATLELWSLLADDGPLVVLVDDTQWLDAPTAEVLAFVARRLDSEPVALLMGLRDGHDSPLSAAPVPSLHLQGLDEEASLALLARTAPALDPTTRGRILREAAGNPLALRELPAALLAQDGSGPLGSDRLPMTTRLERAFADRTSALPPAARAFALVAAASDSDSMAELHAAAAALNGASGRSTDSDAAMSAVLAAGLATAQDGRLRFRHPLIRSATYSAATDAERRAAHAALATAIGESEERRAWHRAASTLQPDEDVAAEIEAAARSARSRGARQMTVAALERAAELSPSPTMGAGRRLAAAELAVEIGDLAGASRLAGQTRSDLLDPVGSGRLRLVREALEPGTPGDPAAVLSLVLAGEDMVELGEPDLALRFLQVAARMAWWADPGTDVRLRVVAAARRVPVPPHDARLLSICAFADADGTGRAVVAATSQVTVEPDDPESALLVGQALNQLGSFDLSDGFLTEALAGLRRRGALVRLPEALTEDAWTALTTGRWQHAAASAEEATRVAEETRQPLWRAAAQTASAMLAGLRGDLPEAERLAGDAEAAVLPLRASAVLCGIQLVRGVTALGAGRYEDAFGQLRRMFDETDPAYHLFQSRWAIGDLAEAAVHTGRVEEGRLIAERYAGGSEQSSWIRTGLLYARPLLAPEAQAEQLFEESLAADLSTWPLYRTRLRLEYGAWLRRRRRNVDARPHLRTARDTADALGLSPWAARARRELRATGESSRAPVVAAWMQLSPQELQIARLAARGLSNREIGEQLFLSHRTVGSHLYRVFPKLGVSSRSELVHHLREVQDDEA